MFQPCLKRFNHLLFSRPEVRASSAAYLPKIGLWGKRKTFTAVTDQLRKIDSYLLFLERQWPVPAVRAVVVSIQVQRKIDFLSPIPCSVRRWCSVQKSFGETGNEKILWHTFIGLLFPKNFLVLWFRLILKPLISHITEMALFWFVFKEISFKGYFSSSLIF